MIDSMNLIQSSPQEFIRFLKKENISRFYFVYDREKSAVIASHEQLKPVADFIRADTRDFMQHEGLFFQISKKHETLQGAFVHRTNRGQAAGGVRYWYYDTMEDYLRDGLRLAIGMTRKNALAGLWWGGGKGVMAHNPAVDKFDPAIRASLYAEYGKLMTSIKGCYVTAEDVGTNVTDMANVFSNTRFTTCIPPSLGGSGNPSVPTARGVICGMEAALEFLGLGSLEGKTIAIQGMGNVGEPLARFLFEKKVARIIGSDINDRLLQDLKKTFTGKKIDLFRVERSDESFLATECDILSPCATGAILNPRTIPNIQAKIVCGAANNQLEDDRKDDRLFLKKGIIYVPDFLTNRMGIVNCANEQYGFVKDDPAIERHFCTDWEHSIHMTATKVFQESKKTGETTGQVAIRLADELSLQNHPVFGHRGQLIIDSLVAERWHEQP